MERVLVLFSGGLDSMLATMKLVEAGYKAVLVHYNNGLSVGLDTINHGVERLINKCGDDKVEFYGTINIGDEFFELINDYYNTKPAVIAKSYPGLTFNQSKCLHCRTVMYAFSVSLCLKLGIKKMAEGARKSQIFAIEQEPMIENYRALLSAHDIELLLPVLDLPNEYGSEFERENEFYLRGMIPSNMEPKCLWGYPTNPLTEEDVLDITRFFEEKLLEPIKQMIREINI